MMQKTHILYNKKWIYWAHNENNNTTKKGNFKKIHLEVYQQKKQQMDQKISYTQKPTKKTESHTTEKRRHTQDLQ